MMRPALASNATVVSGGDAPERPRIQTLEVATGGPITVFPGVAVPTGLMN